MAGLQVSATPIEGLLVVTLPVHADSRGWFKEGWQRAKMVAAGLPDFRPVQMNVSHNDDAGTIRGIHAEPWDKLVGLVAGRAFGAWVDLREGHGFGTTFTLEMGLDQAVFVPRGVGNSYQALSDDTTYTYLTTAHWSPDARDRYTYLNLFDPTAAIGWPLQPRPGQVSDADQHHPMLAAVQPFTRPRPVVVGAAGQLGQALLASRPDAVGVGRDILDITDAQAVASFDFSQASAIINAAAFTRVDDAETAEGRRVAWQANAVAVRHLAQAAREHDLPLVQVSTDYVFDGTLETHQEDEQPSPLGVYGQTKAAGEIAAATWHRHYIIRTSWLIGAGPNFVRTMARLADDDASPAVVDDQFGRLTFTEDLAAAIWHLLDAAAPAGVYNLTNSGATMTWADIARRVFTLRGRNPQAVTSCSTAQWATGRQIAPRPRHSTLSLDKIRALGFPPPQAMQRLDNYLQQL